MRWKPCAKYFSALTATVTMSCTRHYSPGNGAGTAWKVRIGADEPFFDTRMGLRPAACRRGSRRRIDQRKAASSRIDEGGISHHVPHMPAATRRRSKSTEQITVLQDYDVAADAKNRISLRGAKAKYFHVKALSNGSYVLEPRVLVSPEDIPERTLKMLERSVTSLKQGKASPPVDLSPFLEQ